MPPPGDAPWPRSVSQSLPGCERLPLCPLCLSFCSPVSHICLHLCISALGRSVTLLVLPRPPPPPGLHLALPRSRPGCLPPPLLSGSLSLPLRQRESLCYLHAPFILQRSSSSSECLHSEVQNSLETYPLSYSCRRQLIYKTLLQ